MKDQTKILLIAPGLASFVQKDQLILSRIAVVDTLLFKSSKGIKLVFSLLAQFFKLILRQSKYDIIYIWFADYHSFLPVVLSRIYSTKTIIVLGGTDVNCIPELGYGFCSNRIRKFMTIDSIANSDYLIPVDDSLTLKVLERIPTVDGRISTVPTCFDPDLWFCNSKKEDLILTVGIFGSWQRARIKGIDLFVEVARLLPQFEFIVVRASNKAESLFSVPPNVKIFTDVLSDEQLRQLYSRARVYAQLSLSEGLPSSVCEAMLCECLPIGTDVGGMKSAISEYGTVLLGRDSKQIAEKIKELMTSKANLPGRNHIMDNFSFELREKKITEIISQLT